MTTETAEKTFTAKLIIIEPGLPNKGLRVFPAQHEYEKIDLTFNGGRDRWAAVQQTLRQFCPRGKYVPEPISFNPNHPKETNTAPPPAAEWPLVELDGTVLQAPPPIQHVRSTEPDTKEKRMADRIERLEGRLDQLITVIAGNQAKPEPAGNPGDMPLAAVDPTPLAPVDSGAGVQCPKCNKSFRNDLGLKIHTGRDHK